MPPKREFRRPKRSLEEKTAFDDCVPKSTQCATKWAFLKNFCRVANRTCKQGSIKGKLLLSLRCEQNPVESLNLWLTKFVQEVCKAEGERYPSRSLYRIITGLQRHLKERGSEVSLLGSNEGRCVNYFRY